MKKLFPTNLLPTSVLACLLFQVAVAQPAVPTEPGKIGFTSSTTNTFTGKAKLKDKRNSYDNVQINSSAWAIGQELSLGGAGSLSLGIAYNLIDIDNGDSKQLNRAPLPNKLQSLGASLGYSTQIDERWSLSSSLSATSHVANYGLLKKGWGVGGHVMGLYTWSPSLTLAIGLAYDSLSDDWNCVPLLGFEWRPAEHWSVAIGIPKTSVSYELNEKLTLSLALSGDGGTYYIKDDPRPDVAPRSLADSKLEFSELRLGFQADWKVNKAISVSGSLGSVLYREAKYIDRGYKLKSDNIVPFVTLALNVAL